MKVPYNWLKEYVDFDLSPQELGDALSMHALEVESVVNPGEGIKNVVIAEIKELERHPNADKLHVCMMDNGSGQLHQVVCGAPNVRIGMKTVMANVGAKLPGGLEIKKSKLRGVESNGMNCSEKELGVAEDTSTPRLDSGQAGSAQVASGIIDLPADAPVGKDATDYLGLNEPFLEIDILPNRGDAMSIQAIAKEVAAISSLHKKVKTSFPKVPEIKEGSEELDISIKAKDLCYRYMGLKFEGIKIKPSPDWMQQRLQAAGLRPINNVVDITNYVLLDMGQPLHAFDLNKLDGGKIIVRKASKGEKFVTFDEEEIELTDEMLVIADGKKPVALAGVMGSINSAIDENTTTILLESAYFDHASIRKTSLKTDIQTDSSNRFSKYADFDGVERAFKVAADLFCRYADAKIVSKVKDVVAKAIKPTEVKLRTEKATAILGIEVTDKMIKDILPLLDFELRSTKKGLFSVKIPTSRVHDVYREIDLIEEIGRIWGYEKIPSTLPGQMMVDIGENSKEKIKKLVNELLVNSGFAECVTTSLTSPDQLARLGVTADNKNKVVLSSPISSEESVMRTSLLASLLDALKRNISRQEENVALFEIGKVYFKEEEQEKIAGLLYGSPKGGEYFAGKNEEIDLYFVKGIVENILDALNIKNRNFSEITKDSLLHPGRSGEIKGLLKFGELHPLAADKLGLKNKCYLFELDVAQLIKNFSEKKVYQKIPQFPAATRDIAFIVDKEKSYNDIVKVLQKATEKIVERVVLVDRYQGDNIGADKISFCFNIVYRTPEKTLVDKEVNDAHEAIKKAVTEKLGATVR